MSVKALDMIFARDVQVGDVLLMAEYCERLTVLRVHDEVIEDSRVSIRRFETRQGKAVGPIVVRGWWEALRIVEREAGADA